MTCSDETSSAVDDIHVGGLCLLTVMDQHFLVRIVELPADGLKVTFPGADYPVAGMAVYLDFHDETGFTRYKAHVLRGPSAPGDGVLLERPAHKTRTYHRDSCRVTTDLTVQVKDHEHLRLYDAELLNLSAGGALILTSAPFDYTTQVDMLLSLPGEPTLQVRGAVIHLADQPGGHGGLKKCVGLHFVSLDPGSFRTLANFVSRSLKDAYGVE